jgi:prepilin-type N-terminal cleavage/methylation domain-containing protein
MKHKMLGIRSLRQAGYTLIEEVVVVGIIAVLAVFALPVYSNLQNSNGLDVTVNTLVQDLYQAQILSRNEENSSAYGVYITNQTITLYAGSSYATRNTSTANVFTMPVSITVSGLSEIDFSKLYGFPSTTGTFTLKDNSASRVVTINSMGMVDFS